MRRFILILLSLSILMCCGCARQTEEPAAPEKEQKSPGPGPIIISEIMSRNRCTLRDADGGFSDWAELQNISDEAVDLKDWTLTDGGPGWSFPGLRIEPGERLVVFASGKDRKNGELHTDFRLSPGETLSLYNSAGELCTEHVCADIPADCSEVYRDGEYSECFYPTPGEENSAEGFERVQSSSEAEGPLIINEVMTGNRWDLFTDGVGNNDYVELKNISDREIELSDYYLSDDGDNLRLRRLPERKLSPGGITLILCAQPGSGPYPCTGFGLNSVNEQLYLSDDEGLRDWVSLKNIPVNCSYGRIEGENGFYYMDAPSPGADNRYGERRISSAPVSLTPDGIYNDTDSVSVELSGEGKIYFTTDGSLPDTDSTEYTGPVNIGESCVIRAVQIQEGALPSRPLTLSFIINENHSLPVVSLVSDSPALLRHLYIPGNKEREIPGNISYYGEDGSFSIGCGICLTGHDSIRLPKKSFALNFRGSFGEDVLDYDVFGTGHTEYCSLALRAGQDNHRLIFRQEIWQDLCWEMTDEVPNQHSKFCILYLNGEYFGIYCLKERLDSKWYAGLSGGRNVESVNLQGMKNDSFREEVFDFCRENDMSDEDCYQELCSRVDMDSFTDWLIVQGVCGNMDLFQNVRFMRADGGKWQPVLFDLDHSMINDYVQMTEKHRFDGIEHQQFAAFFGNTYWPSSAMTRILKSLLQSDSFTDKFLSRYADVSGTVLSNDSILERISFYEELLSPEVERDWTRWDQDPELWHGYVEHMKELAAEGDWESTSRESLFYYLNSSGTGMSREKFDSYFDLRT